MKRLLLIVVVIALAALALVLTLVGRKAYREAALESRESKYRREWRLGMKRQEIEQQLLSKVIRFFPVSPSQDFVSVGNEISYSFACAPDEVGLQLTFELQEAHSSSGDVLERVSPVREPGACL